MKEKIILVGNRNISTDVLKYLKSDIEQVIINDKTDQMVKVYNKQLSRLTIVNTDNNNNIFYTHHEYKYIFITIEYILNNNNYILTLSDDNKTLIITILESEI